VALRGGDGAITGAAVVVSDISEQKERERLREEWIAVVAHDLRQPLNTILLSTARLLNLCGDGASDQAPPMLERIRGASWRLNRMIEDLLDAARIEANRVTIDHRAVDVGDLVEAEIDNTRLANPDARVRLDAQPHQLAWIDPDRVHQVLANLISNAVKYGTPGAEIVISVGGDEAVTQVTVTNAGPGISPDELGTLFARFTRTRDARSGRQPGIGLGLYICKGLIEAQGGRMWAESEPGRTSFHFTVPKPVGA
jgi:signal transduction histidine kinase